MEGFDTGFFFDLRAGTPETQALWRTVTERDDQAAVSSITLYELSRHGLVGRLDSEFTAAIVGEVGVAFTQAGVDATVVLSRAARITHGMGLPMADALIAASLEHVDCDRLHTGDSDFEAYEGTMEVVFL
ncbi:type II toxin-antitoxin system VapC family toxin [Salinibacter sp.]|uniref:type II toxin-antitoxin system VapC family toxin n=1 Tax=Salinibacter sp. TaxID=2065818 RepID=UPI0021E705AB|nr:PIN domain-containing protein [Salinibacter sp.]